MPNSSLVGHSSRDGLICCYHYRDPSFYLMPITQEFKEGRLKVLLSIYFVFSTVLGTAWIIRGGVVTDPALVHHHHR